MNSKLVVPHVPDCYAMKEFSSGAWNTPWAYFREDAEYRDAIGRRRRLGGVRWLRAVCNCGSCPAELLVREDSILIAFQTEKRR